MVYVGAGLAGLLAVAIIVVGICYLVAPLATAATFGLPGRASESTVGWLHVKGIRDVVPGLLGLYLLATRQFDTLGWVVLIIALIPIGDTLIVLGHQGSKGRAYGIHAATAVALVVAALLLLLG
ncbi:MAG: DUF4267 domain-containing protein [Mycobacterium sp.]